MANAGGGQSYDEEDADIAHKKQAERCPYIYI